MEGWKIHTAAYSNENKLYNTTFVNKHILYLPTNKSVFILCLKIDFMMYSIYLHIYFLRDMVKFCKSFQGLQFKNVSFQLLKRAVQSVAFLNVCLYNIFFIRYNKFKVIILLYL